MAITPQEAKKPTTAETAEIKRLETIIDKHLCETAPDYNGGRHYDIQETTNPKVIDALIRIYYGAGWDVKLERGDQRDPMNALYFTPIKPCEPDPY